MTMNDLALFGLQRTSGLLHLMTDDLTPAEWLHRPTPDANPPAWIVGHIITIEHNAFARIAGDKLPPLPDAGFADRHNKGSKPGDNTSFGDVTKLLPLFDAHRAVMSEAVKTMSAEQFDIPIEHPMFNKLGQLLMLLPVHAGLHIGQLSMLRRTLGKPAKF